MDLLIETIRRYIPLSPEEKDIIRNLFLEQKFGKGEHLLLAGQVWKNIFFIERGLVRYYVSIDGEEKTSYFNKEGEFICDYSSFLPQQPAQTNIQALEEAIVYSISKSNIEAPYQRVREGDRFGLGKLLPVGSPDASFGLVCLGAGPA